MESESIELSFLGEFASGNPQKFPVRAFLSVLPTGSGFLGVLREFDPAQPSERTELRVLHFDNGRNLISDTFLDAGEDPRLFEHRKCFYVLTWTASPTGDWYHWLINIKERTKVQLRIAPWIFHGKNWVPVSIFDSLYVLRSLDPLVVLSVDIASGECQCIHGREEAGRGIGEYRGGGCATHKGGLICGFGHRTIDGDHHEVFGYEVNPKTWKIEITSVHITGIDGMGIVDPTSQWENFVACCATQGKWNRVQPTIHGFYLARNTKQRTQRKRIRARQSQP